MNVFIQQIVATSYWEWIAVILALTYLILAINESIWCWPAAFISTGIYAWLFFDVNLFMESFLNAYYLVMAIYGWQQWNGTKARNADKSNRTLGIIQWELKTHFIIIISSILAIVVFGQFLINYTSQDFAYLDSFTTIFALIATYMVTKKVLENWLYWIVIDFVSVYLFYSKEFVLTAVLFSFYIVLAIIGWFKWKHQYNLISLKSKFVS